MKIKLFAFVLLFALAFTLASCGSKEPEDTTAPVTTTEPPTSQTTTVPVTTTGPVTTQDPWSDLIN